MDGLIEKSASLLLFMFLYFFLSGEEPEKDRIAVMDVADEDNLFDKRTITNVTDYIFARLDSTRLFWMIPKADRNIALEQAIEETLKGSRKECVDEKCQLSLVAQLQANYLIETGIKRLYHGTCNISISKFDVEKRASVGTWETKFDCSEKGLYEAIDGFNFSGAKGRISNFTSGRIGELEDSWTPSMAGTGGQIIVYFESKPDGTTVSIDGEVAGNTPKFKSKMIAKGKHLIKMEKEGYYSEAKILDLKKGDSVKFELEKGILIESVPSGAIVRIDGVLVCQSTPCEKVVEEGERKITVQKELYETREKLVDIKRGENISIELEPNFGWLKIISKYNGVEVKLDGKSIGKMPIDSFKTAPGPHVIEVDDKCYNSVPEQFIIKKGDVKSLDLPAIPKQAAVFVTAEDDDGNDIEAEISADSDYLGKTPGTFKVPVCSNELKAVYKLEEESKPLFLKEKDEVKMKFLFRKKYYEKQYQAYKKEPDRKPEKYKPYKPNSAITLVKTEKREKNSYNFGFMLAIGGTVYGMIAEQGTGGGIGMDVPVGLKYGPFMWLFDFNFYYKVFEDKNDKLNTEFRCYNINGLFRYYLFEYHGKDSRSPDARNIMDYFAVFTSVGTGYLSLKGSSEAGLYAEIGLGLTKFFEFKTTVSYGTESNAWFIGGTTTFNITSWVF